MDSELLVALAALIAMEVVLGIDNLVFIAILSNRLPEAQRVPARRVGLGLAVLMRFAMLAGTTWLLTLTQPWFTVLGMEISGKDLILIAGGLFLIGKATVEIHHRVDPASQAASHAADAAIAAFWPTVFQILLLDLVFSVDSILAAVALTREFWVIATAIVISVLAMLLSMDALSRFMERNPTVVMLALAFLVMIGMVLVAEGFGAEVPKGFVYAAMAFAAAVEGLNLLARRARKRGPGNAPDE
ncbi:TerC family protein [Siccirubricoccus sp. KC 17139]|uniref:TerC family protein n=1 Tax=Siccirubricoccus soli TaxID=2899147 RepID=A0ABT1D0D3_9PROT|nr:TerC family protein [Siccirubricoccus soli]MCO6415378.1 TerC family protein [Siccirubricoccus soli]MCP2681510.1 TerC family protein [Siccirubricoccus soli]